MVRLFYCEIALANGKIDHCLLPCSRIGFQLCCGLTKTTSSNNGNGSWVNADSKDRKAGVAYLCEPWATFGILIMVRTHFDAR